MPIDAGHELTAGAADAISEARAAELAASLFGVRSRAQRLDGEYDDNFHLTGDGTNRGWVFKISHPAEDEAVIALQHEAIRRAGFGQPRLATTEIDGVRRYARLLDWIPGTLLAHAQPQSAALLRSLGA